MMHLTDARLLLALLALSAHPFLKDGNSLSASEKSAGASPCLLVPAVQKLRLAAARAQSMNNLKQIALALHSHHDVYKSFPAAAICDKDGKPLLSWRVAILPFIEEATLYNEFKLDEPWDSAHNRKLIPRMPKVYVVPAAPAMPNETYYRVFVGNGAVFDPTKGTSFNQITDGTSNTILCFEARQSVTWTKPDDLSFDEQKPLPKFADFYGSGTFLAAFCDGAVHTLRSNIGEAAMRAYITRAGGEAVAPPDN